MTYASDTRLPAATMPIWGDLSAPVDPYDTQVLSRAQSYLSGPLINGQCPPLTIEQAHDVLAWAGITL